jgi:hypothetical protein
VVRLYNSNRKPTNQVQMYFSRIPEYFTNDGQNPFQNLRGKINNTEDAEKLLAKAIAASIKFIRKHFEYVDKAKRLGIE